MGGFTVTHGHSKVWVWAAFGVHMWVRGTDAVVISVAPDGSWYHQRRRGWGSTELAPPLTGCNLGSLVFHWMEHSAESILPLIRAAHSYSLYLRGMGKLALRAWDWKSRLCPLLYHVVAWVGKDSLLPSPAEAGEIFDPAPYNMQLLEEQALSPSWATQ